MHKSSRQSERDGLVFSEKNKSRPSFDSHWTRWICRPAPKQNLQQTGYFCGLLSVLRSSAFRFRLSKTADDRQAIIVQSSQAHRLFEGWGTSLCWFANVVGGFPDPLRNHLMDLIFDKKLGLGLEICRYNIGGSGWNNRDTKNFRYGADIPRHAQTPNSKRSEAFCHLAMSQFASCLPNMCQCCSFWGPDGTWDWGQDANQRWVMLQARDRGACHFEAFSNSPPYWMTNSGRASGNTFAWLGEQ